MPERHQTLSMSETSFGTLGVPAPLIAALTKGGITIRVPDPGRHPARHPGRPRRARPRQDRLRQDPRLRHPDGRPPRRQARRRPAPRRPPARPRARPDPRAGHPDHRDHRAARRGVRPEGHHDLRRRLAATRRSPRCKAGVDIVVACPGRLEDLMQQRFVALDAVEITVLDEADHMADLGFLPGRHAHPGQDPERRPAPAVLRHPGQRRGQDRQALPAQRGAPLGRRRQLARRGHDAPRLRGRLARGQEGPRADARLGHRPPHPVHAHQAPREEARQAADGCRHPGRRPARQPVAGAARPQPRRRSPPGTRASWWPRMSPRAASTSTTSNSSCTSTRRPSTRPTCTAAAAPPAPDPPGTSRSSCCRPSAGTPPRCCARPRSPPCRSTSPPPRPSVVALVGEVAAYVKPQPRAAVQPQGPGRGRSAAQADARRAPTPSASARTATAPPPHRVTIVPVVPRWPRMPLAAGQVCRPRFQPARRVASAPRRSPERAAHLQHLDAGRRRAPLRASRAGLAPAIHVIGRCATHAPAGRSVAAACRIATHRSRVAARHSAGRTGWRSTVRSFSGGVVRGLLR